MRKINKSELLAYIKAGGYSEKGGIVYQPWESLIEVADLGQTGDLENAVAEAKEISAITCEQAIEYGYQEIGTWAKPEDLLVCMDGDITICIPQIYKDKISA